MSIAKNPIPKEIILHKRSRRIELVYAHGERYQLPCAYLRISSPSAEVKRHGNPQQVLGKEQVNVLKIELVGQYGIKPLFSDGHSTGIFSWSLLYELAVQQEERWQQYLVQANVTNGET